MIIGFSDDIKKIDENLFIGDYMVSINYNILTQYNISHILVCGEELSCRYPRDFKYKHLMIADTPSTQISDYFQEVYEFIKDGLLNGCVLVHCAQARSRSVSMIISYIMKSKQISFKKAFEMLKKKHPIADPNQGFKKQLVNYEQVLFKKRSSCTDSLF